MDDNALDSIRKQLSEISESLRKFIGKSADDLISKLCRIKTDMFSEGLRCFYRDNTKFIVGRNHRYFIIQNHGNYITARFIHECKSIGDDDDVYEYVKYLFNIDSRFHLTFPTSIDGDGQYILKYTSNKDNTYSDTFQIIKKSDSYEIVMNDFKQTFTNLRTRNMGQYIKYIYLADLIMGHDKPIVELFNMISHIVDIENNNGDMPADYKHAKFSRFIYSVWSFVDKLTDYDKFKKAITNKLYRNMASEYAIAIMDKDDFNFTKKISNNEELAMLIINENDFCSKYLEVYRKYCLD